MIEHDVFRIDDENNRLGQIGRVAVDDRYRLSLVKAEAGGEADLQKAIKEVNGSDTLLWKHPTDRLTEDGRSAIMKDKIARSDPNFVVALQDNLRRWHMMELDLPEPEEEEDEDEGEEE